MYINFNGFSGLTTIVHAQIQSTHSPFVDVLDHPPGLLRVELHTLGHTVPEGRGVTSEIQTIL